MCFLNRAPSPTIIRSVSPPPPAPLPPLPPRPAAGATPLENQAPILATPGQTQFIREQTRTDEQGRRRKRKKGKAALRIPLYIPTSSLTIPTS